MGLTKAPRVFLLAGEASGDIHAAHLARALRELVPGVELVGAGGPRMAEAGVRRVVDTSAWGVVGYVEAYVRLPLFALRFRRVVSRLRELRPDAVVLVDFPGFNVFVAKAVCQQLPTVYYFPPMAYGRRGGRARVLARMPVRVLTTFPFEYEEYRAAGADVVFVGHPAVDLARPALPREELWAQLGLKPDVPLLALLPGSRVQEVRALLPIQLLAYRLLRERGVRVQAAVAVASERLKPMVGRILQRYGADVPAPTGRTYDLLAYAEAAVVTSGTATLEAALLGTPAVVVYRVSRPTAWIARRVATVPWVGLPNLLAGRLLLPELLQERCRPELVAQAVQKLLEDPARAEELRRQLRSVAAAVGPPGAVRRAAQEVARRLGLGQQTVEGPRTAELARPEG
ncbi:MAG: lipid-A-disaccharide synthase [Armatimonadota bacterium]|nr:lipid-A-disaccharide synthase [Armatimonadota bacterium]MDW8156035.1 lipid-A-disaccharide synthase [Armatimonadota bacterium]